MDYNNRNIVLNELIGLKVRVLKSLDKKQQGITGLVIDETKNTIIVEAENGSKKIIKKISTFKFYFGRRTFVVNGAEINFRPYERIEKAMKFYKRRS